MSGYGHYKNSKASMNNWSPAYTAQFEISFTPPAGISDWDITLENVKKIGGIDTNFLPEPVEQKYKGAIRSFVGGGVPEQKTDITIDFELNLDDSNSLYVYKALRKWSDLAYDPLTGKFGMKKDYIGGPLIISFFNKEGDIYRQVTYPVVFPISKIPFSPDWDWAENGIVSIEGWTLRADFPDESWV